jgi:serine/threonine-protein kinase
VYRQAPVAGERKPKGSDVHIWVSTGLPKAEVPSLVGRSSTDAVAALTRLRLKPDLHDVPSAKPSGEVTAQDPPAGTKLTLGESVRVNVSKGPQPIAVPSVAGQPIAQATSVLRAAGFQVSPTFVDDNEPKNTVIAQNPSGGASAGRNSIVEITVSNGPTTSTVPDVTSTDVDSAQQTLVSSGFRSRVVAQDTDDPNADGLVISQSPDGGSQAPAKTVVTLTVGRYVAAPTDTTTTPTTLTPTTPTPNP